jgi:hypothetical protein
MQAGGVFYILPYSAKSEEKTPKNCEIMFLSPEVEIFLP